MGATAPCCVLCPTRAVAAALRFTHLLAHAFNLLVDISKEAFKLVLNLICTQHDTETRTHNKGRGRGRGKGRGKERVSRSKQTNKHTKRSSLHPGSLHTCTRRCQGWTFQSLSSQLPWRKEGSTCLPCPGTIKKQEEDKSKTKTHQQASKQHTHTHTHTHTREKKKEKTKAKCFHAQMSMNNDCLLCSHHAVPEHSGANLLCLHRQHSHRSHSSHHSQQHSAHHHRCFLLLCFVFSLRCLY